MHWYIDILKDTGTLHALSEHAVTKSEPIVGPPKNRVSVSLDVAAPKIAVPVREVGATPLEGAYPGTTLLLDLGHFTFRTALISELPAASRPPELVPEQHEHLFRVFVATGENVSVGRCKLTLQADPGLKAPPPGFKL